MPCVSKKQCGLMRADLGRAKAGKKTRTGMSENQLWEWVASSTLKKKRRK